MDSCADTLCHCRVLWRLSDLSIGRERKQTHLCNQATPVESSVLGKNIAHAHEHHEECDHDHFHMTHPDTEWKSCNEHAVKIGLGTNEYDLETI